MKVVFHYTINTTLEIKFPITLEEINYLIEL